MTEHDAGLIVVGKISGIYGVQGWVRVFSYTSPRTNILNYSPWQIQGDTATVSMNVVDGGGQGKGVVAHLEGCDDRDSARKLIGSQIKVLRSQLPAAGKNEYYWADLIGLKVLTLDGAELGKVDGLIETGANDVLVVKGDRERLIPYVQGQVIVEVNLDQHLIRVDWDPEF